MFSDAGKTYFGIPYIFASNLTLVFAFFIFSSDTFFGGANKDKIKKAIFPDSQSFVNLKSKYYEKHSANIRISEMGPNS